MQLSTYTAVQQSWRVGSYYRYRGREVHDRGCEVRRALAPVLFVSIMISASCWWGRASHISSCRGARHKVSRRN